MLLFFLFPGNCAKLLVEMMDFNCRENDLQEAIETGDLARVKQLVGSGINLNSTLHSVTRRESATILGMAAFEGRIEIMEYLIKAGASVNLKDPYFGRNALHWACQGGWFAGVKLLLQFKVDVNCVDRDNVSPILRASMTGSADITKLLIRHGAEVSQQDRLRSSALHYSSFHGTASVTRELIKAGCIHNNPTIFGQGTPLANLVYHSDITNCSLLLEAGYTLENETWLSSYEDNSLPNTDKDFSACVEIVLKARRTVPPLVKMCRVVVRKVMAGVNLNVRMAQLPLPHSLVCYLCLQ